jgi:nucleotide-binding universal stress UspA family protein
MEKNQNDKSKNKDFNRIIAAVDGSKYSKRAAKKAIDLAKETGIDIEALYVVHQPNSVYPGFGGIYPGAVGLMKKEGNSILKEIRKMGSKMDVDVKTKLVVGFPDQEIIKEAGKNDLIVMGCKGHSALSRILMGNVCEKVMHHSNSHVMVLR